MSVTWGSRSNPTLLFWHQAWACRILHAIPDRRGVTLCTSTSCAHSWGCVGPVELFSLESGTETLGWGGVLGCGAAAVSTLTEEAEDFVQRGTCGSGDFNTPFPLHGQCHLGFSYCTTKPAFFRCSYCRDQEQDMSLILVGVTTHNTMVHSLQAHNCSDPPAKERDAKTANDNNRTEKLQSALLSFI